MPPVITSASTSDVDNDATAELPVLDVAAYESTLNEPVSRTDTWVVPGVELTAALPVTSEASRETPAYDLDHSGTHEMPAMPASKRSGIRKSKAARAPKPATAPAPQAEQIPVAAPPAIVVPPSPPLIEDLRNALATAERRIEELNERARIGDAERLVAVERANAESTQLRAQLAQQAESLQSARERLDAARADVPELEDKLMARGDRISALEAELLAQTATLREKTELLAKSEHRRAILECDVANLRATVAHRNSRIEMLEADLAARQARQADLSARLADALASTDPYVPRLRSELHARDEQIRLLKLDVELARVQVAEKDHDLQVAEESIRNLELEVRDKNSKLDEVNVTVEEWRAVIAESQRSILQRDSQIQALQSDLQKRAATGDSAAQTGEEVALEGPARVLIRTSGNTDFVHVLGRRTRIGRGADNDLVLDTKHVSRYHAVFLAGPVHTSVEDLKSTNGVFVNGRRVSRHILKDGDRVTVGRTQFRYCVRD
jgi:pSer/pThr/pTyr-binding forkhead associated (FHA) protein